LELGSGGKVAREEGSEVVLAATTTTQGT
jgi:hypothetical protein